MTQNIDDTRIRELRPLVSPAILIEEIPASDEVARFVSRSRKAVSSVIRGEDDRLVVIVGPCSIHDVEAAREYANLLKPVADRLDQELLIVMRVYFEKPRTVVGWKGLINDPFIDNSFQINTGLRLARDLLREVNEIGLPTSTEFLDTIFPQFFADLVSWAAIGARTTESQVHRELSSGLSMPVGFKNGTGGNVQMAVDAIRSAKCPHWFPSVTKQGVAAIFNTEGNPDCHLILRGGSRTGPNFSAKDVSESAELLKKHNLPPLLMVDCSHANSAKDHNRQLIVGEDLCHQIRKGQTAIAGIMIESNLVEGSQSYEAGKAAYGVSITDACLGFEETVGLLESFADAVKVRRSGPDQ